MNQQDKRCTYNVTLKRVCVAIATLEDQYILHILIVCVALFIQHAKRMRLIVISSETCPTLQCFSALFHKRYDFRKEVVLGFPSTFAVKFLIIKKFSEILS